VGVFVMDDFAVRRLAVQLATQLPSDQGEARAVVGALHDLMDNWLYLEERPRVRPAGRDPPCNNVISLIGNPDSSPRKT
jgi:hypothetical protein